MKVVSLKTGEKIPAVGLGTWAMGERSAATNDEIKALQLGLDLGMTVIDTAEMYGEGGAEKVVGKAIAGRRDGVYLVSKVYPHNASRDGVVAACERSLRRLATDRLDLYLLHWPGSEPLSETVAGFEQLKKTGKIRAWGVSNFDGGDMARLARVPDGDQCVANQVLYHLGERGIEWQLAADNQKADVLTMAYSPLGQASILDHSILAAIGRKYAVSAAAIALAFVLRNGAMAIPKAASLEHVRANVKALDIVLDQQDLAEMNKVYPPPTRAARLAML